MIHFFLQHVPAYLATSPLPSAIHLMEKGVEELHLLTDSPEPVTITGTTDVPAEPIHVKDLRSDSSWDEAKGAGRPRRKVLKKKKRKGGNIRSVSMPENVADQEAMFEMDSVNSNSSEDEEVSKHMFGDRETGRSISSPQIKDMGELQGTTSHRKMSYIGNGSFVTPFSDPEMSPITRFVVIHSLFENH